MKKVLVMLIMLTSIVGSSYAEGVLDPASPLNPMYVMGDPALNVDTNKSPVVRSNVDYSIRKYKMYELCYKDKCRQTISREVKDNIQNCLIGGGGYACLSRVIK